MITEEQYESYLGLIIRNISRHLDEYAQRRLEYMVDAVQEYEAYHFPEGNSPGRRTLRGQLRELFQREETDRRDVSGPLNSEMEALGREIEAWPPRQGSQSMTLEEEFFSRGQG